MTAKEIEIRVKNVVGMWKEYIQGELEQYPDFNIHDVCKTERIKMLKSLCNDVLDSIKENENAKEVICTAYNARWCIDTKCEHKKGHKPTKRFFIPGVSGMCTDGCKCRCSSWEDWHHVRCT